MVDRLSKFLVGPREEAVLQVPITVAVPGQPLPVRVSLRMQLSSSDLVLSPAALDLGRVPLGEGGGGTLVLHNPGKLPQTFSFGCPGAAGRPPGVTITPGDGYGTVLPGESVALTVAFRPPIAGPQRFRLRCTTLAGRAFEVEGRCEGVDAPVALSHNAVKVGCGREVGACAHAVCPSSRLLTLCAPGCRQPHPTHTPAWCNRTSAAARDGGGRHQHGVAGDHQPRRQPPGV